MSRDEIIEEYYQSTEKQDGSIDVSWRKVEPKLVEFEEANK